MNDLIAFLPPQCMWCKTPPTPIELPADRVREWQAGAYVQVAFPKMLPDQRELLITGTHPACWDAMFPDEDDEEF